MRQFGQLILSNIIKIVAATKSHIFQNYNAPNSISAFAIGPLEFRDKFELVVF